MKETTVLKKNKNLLMREIEDETILVPFKGELDYIYTLNPTGAAIWKIINGKKTVGQIKKALAKKTGFTTEDISKDVDFFLSELKQAKAVR